MSISQQQGQGSSSEEGRGEVKNIGFDSIDDDFSSSDSKRQNYQDCEVVVRIENQNLDHDGKDELDLSSKTRMAGRSTQ